MVFFRLATVAAVLALFSGLCSAAPTDQLDEKARGILARATQAAPHFVIYADKWTGGNGGPPAVDALKGYNTL